MISSYALKIVALVSMFIDHTGYTLALSQKLSASPYLVMRSLGRMAFPIYAFLLVNGFEKTRDRAKYLTRLCIFAVISQIPFCLAFNKVNYDPWDDVNCFRFGYGKRYALGLLIIAAAMIILNYRRKNIKLSASALAAYLTAGMSFKIGGCTLLGGKLNVFYTLACSLSAICVLHMCKNRERYPNVPFAAAVVTCAAVSYIILGRSDYGYKGLLFIVLLYFFREKRNLQALGIILWSFFCYSPFSSTTAWWYFIGAALSVVPILLYSGAEGKKSRLFYYFYPAHLAVLGVLCHFILK